MTPNNQSAFPSTIDGLVDPGMTLRDFFAAEAMQSLMGSVEMFKAVTQSGEMNGVKGEEGLAIAAYEIADAMLAERAKAQ